MARAYNVIDSDGHILEPLTLWDDYIDPAFRDRAPKVVVDTDGKQRLQIEEQVLGSRQGMGGLGGVGARQGVVSAETMSYEDGRPGGFDPHKRIPDMDLDGIDAAFLYPSMGLFAGAVHDPALAGAMCRAYNRWLADYCKPYPDRLFGIAMLPLQSVDHAIAEMRFARRDLGFRGGFIRPNPYNNRMLHDPAYEPLWSAAEDLDFSIGIHEGGNSGMPTVGIDRFEGRGAQHIISHTMEMMLACMSMIWGGVCERHPKLRIGFLESGVDCAVARPHGQAFRRSGLQRFRPEDQAQRALPAQLLDLVRAGRRQPKGARRVYRAAQNPVGDRLPAPRRLLPRRAADDQGPDGRRVPRRSAPGAGWRRDGVLWPELRSAAIAGASRPHPVMIPVAAGIAPLETCMAPLGDHLKPAEGVPCDGDGHVVRQVLGSGSG
jgi:uncharacterized protein